MKKIQFLPNVLTALSLTCGLFVIFKMAQYRGEVDGVLIKSMAGFLLLAGLFDLLDGAIARVVHAESEFGGFFDSLSDSISFGVAPSVIVLTSIETTDSFFWINMAAIMFCVCGVLRLVRFNVNSAKIKGDSELEIAAKKNFTGLPIPAAASALVSLNLLLLSGQVVDFFKESFRAPFLAGAMVLLSYLMVSCWKFPSAKRLHVRVASFQVVFFTVVGSVFLFWGFLYQFEIVFFLLSWGYLLLALILGGYRIFAGRKTKALEDFEPETESLDS